MQKNITVLEKSSMLPHLKYIMLLLSHPLKEDMSEMYRIC